MTPRYFVGGTAGRKEGRKEASRRSVYVERAVACLRCVHTNLTNRRESLVYRRRKAESSPSFGRLTPRGLIAPSPTAARNFAGPSAVNSRIRVCVCALAIRSLYCRHKCPLICINVSRQFRSTRKPSVRSAEKEVEDETKTPSLCVRPGHFLERK